MRPRLIAAATVAIAVAVAVVALHGAPRSIALGPNPVVVELFTSQG